MDGSGDGINNQPSQNLNDLQNLLVSFNREIEDQPVLPTPTIVTADPVFLESADGEDITEGTVEVSTSQAFPGFYTEQNTVLESSLPENTDINENQIITAVTSTENEAHNTVISPGVQITASPRQLTEDILQPGQDVSLQSLQPQDLAALSHSGGNVLRIVSIGNDGQMHIVSEDQLQQESEITGLSADHLTEQIVDNSVEGHHNLIDGTDPVAVLASVAANTSSVSHLQTVNLSQGDIHNPQLVALQNSADSSQPQLVAVQNADGTSTEAVQIIGAEAATLNQALFSGHNNSFQTVTLVPSETGPGGEVSYMLIMSPPDGEDGEGTAKAISLDMSVYDFKEEAREITEEIIEEDGKMRRIVRITPKSNFLGNGQLMCSYCNYTSPKRYLLTRHMKTHSEDRPHKCHICERGFKTLASLTNHVNTHTGIRPHKCKLCESAFTTSGELVRHVRYKHTFEKPHKCTMCGYASVELSKLKRHMRSHTGERPYQCPHCDYASPDTYKLKRHLRIHTGEKPYECNICHARFTQSNSLKAHKLIHTGTKPVFQCEHCPTTCGRRTDLKIHIQKLHMSERPLLCRKCGETFPDRYTYKIHIKSHEGEKCFKCDTCGHAALSQRHLESHQLIHTGEKPFECESCEHSFRQKQLLKRHQNLHHTSCDESNPDDKAHDCQGCPKNKGILAHHLTDGNINDETGEGESLNSIITQNILQKNLMQEWRDGKLGNAQQVVIVHPDGTVEEVTHKLQGPEQHGTCHLHHVDNSIEQENEVDIKPDISQLVIKTEKLPTESDNDIIITGLPVSEDVLDETKEAGTQAEIESDGEDADKTDGILGFGINMLNTTTCTTTPTSLITATSCALINTSPPTPATITSANVMSLCHGFSVASEHVDGKEVIQPISSSPDKSLTLEPKLKPQNHMTFRTIESRDSSNSGTLTSDLTVIYAANSSEENTTDLLAGKTTEAVTTVLSTVDGETISSHLTAGNPETSLELEGLSTELSADQSKTLPEAVATELTDDHYETLQESVSSELTDNQKETLPEVVSTDSTEDQSETLMEAVATELTEHHNLTLSEVVSTELTDDQNECSSEGVSIELTDDQDEHFLGAVSTEVIDGQNETLMDAGLTEFTADNIGLAVSPEAGSTDIPALCIASDSQKTVALKERRADRQTRSMKRKEQDDSKSPAKRTRRATAEQC